MRQFKFRAWDKDLCKYLEGCEISSLMADFDAEGDGREIIIKQICPTRYIFEQYIGLKDKNSKEIYEGDIVRCWNGLDYLDGSVKWSENSAAYFVKYFEKKDCFDEDDWLCDCYCEVIGNVHENPELIGGEE